MGNIHLSRVDSIIQGFNYLVGLKLPIWLSLRMFALEYHPLEFVIANSMGKLLGVDPTIK